MMDIQATLKKIPQMTDEALTDAYHQTLEFMLMMAPEGPEYSQVQKVEGALCTEVVKRGLFFEAIEKCRKEGLYVRAM